ncbi:MAG: MATE family efflux transporter [Lachnospiraceae bacterium]|nr:MATE family efflux transporter [Lachnospiraceae bacterium]
MKFLDNSINLTEGSISRNILKFAVPLMIGNLLQQFYNIVDTLIVGRCLGEQALAAVGSAYTLMIFLTSIICGLCMGSSTFFAILFGRKETERMKQSFFISFVSILAVTVVINILVYVFLNGIVRFMQIPAEVQQSFGQYMAVIFAGILATFLYNYFANLLRAVGNSVVPLLFLAISTIINVILDLVFVITFGWGVAGAAAATVIAQYFSGVGILLYYLKKCPDLRISREHMKWNRQMFGEIANLSMLTCVQQSIMNFGILLVQGLVNSFGTVVMAAFAAGVKIDTVAYAPVQDFGNAFSTFIAQNYGAGKTERIRKGITTAGVMVVGFCVVISALVFFFADRLMMIFVKSDLVDIISVGAGYLRVEGSCYVGIGILFLLYGYFRAIKRPFMSVVLTVISLGTRVVLAYGLASVSGIGVLGIWAAIPIGWLLADVTGIIYGVRINKLRKV